MELRLKETIILILFAFIILNYGLYSKFNKVKEYDKKYKIVDNSSTYYSLINIVDNFIKKSNSNNIKEIMNYLDKDYKSRKKITEDNIFEYIKDCSDGQYSFSGGIMYFTEISEDISDYFIKGEIEKQEMEKNSSQDYYLVLRVDKANKTFSIIPDDGKRYKEALDAV